MTVLEIKNIKKTFQEKDVLKDLNLTINEGEIYGFVGGNGSGKTTTMKLILGLLKEDAGDIYVCGERVIFGNNKTNQYVGFLEDVPVFYEFFTAKEYLKFLCDVSGIKDTSRIEKLLQQVGLEGVDTKIKGYSRGMRQRLGVAAALIHEPKLLLCDEPTSALDPTGRKDVLNILNDIKDETTIIFSTHILSDVEKICNRAGVLQDGVLKKEWDLKEMEDKSDGIFLSVNDEAFVKLKEVFNITPYKNGYVVKDASLEAVYNALNHFNIYPSHIEVLKTTLEDLYLQVAES